MKIIFEKDFNKTKILTEKLSELLIERFQYRTPIQADEPQNDVVDIELPVIGSVIVGVDYSHQSDNIVIHKAY
jgi:hypothetical protein